MPLESATYISDLNTSNPVGSTDKVQTLDDHVRLLKSTLKTTFPSVTGAVTATHTELNVLDGITATTAELNILDGVTLTASNINDAALKSASNTFTASQTIASDAVNPTLTIKTTNGVAVPRLALENDTDTWWVTRPGTGAGLQLHDGTQPRFSFTADNSTTTFNGVPVSDFARLSQSNTFTAAQTITGKSLTIADTSTDNPFLQFNTSAGTQKALLQITSTIFDFFAASGYSMRFRTNGTEALSIDTSQKATFAGAVLAPTIANSDSETLVAGQLHFIDGNATLPNLTAGQWVQVVNDSASPITISKNGSDTTYYALTGATISTSFTLAARGILTARCNPAGSAVYVSGSGITAAS